MPNEGINRKEYLISKFGGLKKANEIYNNINTVGKKNGIFFQFNNILKIPNSFPSHKLLALAYKKNKQNEILESLFFHYFLEGNDISNIKILTLIAKQHNIFDSTTEKYLFSIEDNQNLINEEKHARSIGIRSVPSFIINKEFVIVGAQDKIFFIDI